MKKIIKITQEEIDEIIAKAYNDGKKDAERIQNKASAEQKSGFKALDSHESDVGMFYVHRNMHDKSGYSISLMPEGTSELIDICFVENDENGGVKIVLFQNPMTDEHTNVFNIQKYSFDEFRKEYGDNDETV